MSRTFVPCRRCGAEHTNPRSCSLCETCGPIEHKENAARMEEDLQRRPYMLQRLDDCDDIDQLKDWLEDLYNGER